MYVILYTDNYSAGCGNFVVNNTRTLSGFDTLLQVHFAHGYFLI